MSEYADQNDLYDFSSQVETSPDGKQLVLSGAAALEADQVFHFWQQEQSDGSHHLTTDEQGNILIDRGSAQLETALVWSISHRTALANTMRTAETLARNQHRSWSPTSGIKDASYAVVVAETYERSVARSSALLLALGALSYELSQATA